METPSVIHLSVMCGTLWRLMSFCDTTISRRTIREAHVSAKIFRKRIYTNMFFFHHTNAWIHITHLFLICTYTISHVLYSFMLSISCVMQIWTSSVNSNFASKNWWIHWVLRRIYDRNSKIIFPKKNLFPEVDQVSVHLSLYKPQYKNISPPDQVYKTIKVYTHMLTFINNIC